jgi:hypothetical protein
MKNLIKNLSLSLACLLPISAQASSSLILDGAIKAGNNRNYAQVSAFTPLVSSKEDLIFGDIRYMHHLPKAGKKKNSLYDSKAYEANFGLGYRKALDDEMVAGTAAYYDIRNSMISKDLFSQVTLNIHLLTSTWQTHANLYIPVGKKKITKTDSKFTGKGKVLSRDIFFTYDQNKITEKSLSGFDFRLSRNIPGFENVRMGSLFYYFKDKKALAGGGIDVSWTINENVKFEASYAYDRVRKSNILAGVRFSLPIDKALKRRAVDELMATRVERDLDIVTNRDNGNTTKQDIQQLDMMAIRKGDLSDVNDTNVASKNLAILSKLQDTYDKKGTLILADDGEEFDFNNVSKIGGDEFQNKVITEKAFSTLKLVANLPAREILDAAAADSDPLSRQIKILGAQKANQLRTNSSGLFVGGQMKLSLQTDLNNLFAKYATTNANGNKIFNNVTLPGYPNAVVERAGSMLLVKNNGQVYAIVGTDEKNQNEHKNDGKLPLNIWFGGKVDNGDVDVAETVTRETFEESAGSVYISQQDFNDAINEGRFFYSPRHKNLTIVHPDSAGIYNTRSFTNNLNGLKQNPAIVKSMKEIASYHMVHISQIIGLHKRMSNNPSQNHFDPAYNVKDINGNDLRIDYYYARAFGATPQGLNAVIKANSKL